MKPQNKDKLDSLVARLRNYPKDRPVSQEDLVAAWEVSKSHIPQYVKDRIANPQPYRDPPKLLTG